MKTAYDLMQAALQEKPKKPTLDGVDGGSATLSGADSFTKTDIKMKTAAAIQQWAETDDLDDGETYADRLFALLVGIADMNQDGELDDDENAVLTMALECAWDYLVQYGVSEDDADALLNNWDADAGERIVDLMVSALPSEDDADGDIDAFAFTDSDQDAVFDAVMDAVYKKRVVVRNGKKVRINKRVSGSVRLTAKQKIAIRKAQLKSHSAKAMMRRMKSLKVRKKSGL